MRDKLVIDKFGSKKLIKGVSADIPAPPTEVGPSMEVAQITLPPYLYDPIRDPQIKLYDNKRYTMRDIGKLEKRISNLEVMTSLTALEADTKSSLLTTPLAVCYSVIVTPKCHVFPSKISLLMNIY